MKEHVNFYENIKEANMRLEHTLVTYDGEPYYIYCITDHKSDGIFRVYMERLNIDGRLAMNEYEYVPYDWQYDGGQTRGDKMDEFLKEHPDCGIIRKHMNSPKFNKFRPFPLGMANVKNNVMYISRSPTRHTQQGLTSSMVRGTLLQLRVDDRGPSMQNVAMTSGYLYDTILGNYPSAQECIEELTKPTVQNKGAAFHREFAFLSGPINTLYLAYKTDVIGFLPRTNLEVLNLSKDFLYVKESIESTYLFNEINII